MAQQLSKKIYENLRELHAIDTTEDMSLMCGRSRSYLRSNWSRGEEIALSAYTALFFSIERLKHATEAAAAEASDAEEKAALSNGAEDLQLVMNQIWDQMAELSAAAQQ